MTRTSRTRSTSPPTSRSCSGATRSARETSARRLGSATRSGWTSRRLRSCPTAASRSPSSTRRRATHRRRLGCSKPGRRSRSSRPRGSLTDARPASVDCAIFVKALGRGRESRKGCSMTGPLLRGLGLAAVGAVLFAVSLVGGSAGRAATPVDGTVGPVSGSSTAWDFAPVGPGVSSGGTIEFLCAPVYCDSYQLTVALPQPDQQFYLTHKATLHIDYTWTSSGPDDMDVFAFAPDGTESGPGSPDDISTGAGHEALDIANPASGVWTIESHVGVTDEPTVAHAVATLTYDTIPAPPNPTLSGSAPRFSDASPPTGYQTTDVLARQNAGEPSLGVDWKTGNAMYMAGTQISRVSFNDSVSPPKATWTDVTPPQQSVVNEDAILFTDPVLGKTFTEGLLVAGSNGGTTPDDGVTWSPTTFPVPHGPDHETVGAGPYHQPAPVGAGLGGYPNAVYYCS